MTESLAEGGVGGVHVVFPAPPPAPGGGVQLVPPAPDIPPVEDLRELRDIIFRKYQRRRASAEDFAAVDKMLRDQTRDG